MLQRNYRDSLLRLGLLASEEAELIFGGLSRLLPVHQHLKERLAQARGRDGSVDCVALILQEWVSIISITAAVCELATFRCLISTRSFPLSPGPAAGGVRAPLCQSIGRKECAG